MATVYWLWSGSRGLQYDGVDTKKPQYSFQLEMFSSSKESSSVMDCSPLGSTVMSGEPGDTEGCVRVCVYDF